MNKIVLDGQSWVIMLKKSQLLAQRGEKDPTTLKSANKLASP